ncbi:hypothetical protein CPIN17260_1031 [Campylobacter pinnipediorum subsp. pinnipediorum]|uniref:ATP/GTP-binding protein n=1 Tax=Campylobacter pinnipediorum TaxID=1965231 RepID=UPI00084DA112|nr:ATP/GTP-binding protein [Campylobacter pinnipediorum]AQW81323.1 hypothetical protein CPIN17260_1031 [Campylobacter pinnipediorum subsp. pinnipediorum]
MQTKLYSQSNFNSFDFSFKTSSGDKINLAMYDNKNIEYKNATDGNTSFTSLSLKHEYGYEFSYVGDGLDANDMAEIKKALEEISPKIDEFMKNVNEGMNFSNQEIANLANSMKQKLPEARDLNHSNLIADSTLKAFDDLLAKNKASRDLLIKTQKLFENLLDKTNKFSFYV